MTRREIFGACLREARKNARMSLRELAAAVGVTYESIRNYERGSYPRTPVLLRLLEVLHVSEDWLFGLEGITHRREIFGRRLKKLRELKGLSQAELAKKMFVTHQVISRYEAGSYEPPLDTLAKLAEEFQVSTDYLLGLKEE